MNEDGLIEWDDQGTRCQVCVEIAVQSICMTPECKSLKEIRDFIDERYKNGYAAPTNNAMPS